MATCYDVRQSIREEVVLCEGNVVVNVEYGVRHSCRKTTGQ
jgi:hypothetical protein